MSEIEKLTQQNKAMRKHLEHIVIYVSNIVEPDSIDIKQINRLAQQGLKDSEQTSLAYKEAFDNKMGNPKTFFDDLMGYIKTICDDHNDKIKNQVK